jgi:DNA-binding NarL/FixJ family response regulator
LILMDVGLPLLNGIEAARRIRELVPESKIIFLSQESSADIAKEALGTGAWGYVVKAKAATQLIAAVDEALQQSNSGCVTGPFPESLTYPRTTDK